MVEGLNTQMIIISTVEGSRTYGIIASVVTNSDLSPEILHEHALPRCVTVSPQSHKEACIQKTEMHSEHRTRYSWRVQDYIVFGQTRRKHLLINDGMSIETVWGQDGISHIFCNKALYSTYKIKSYTIECIMSLFPGLTMECNVGSWPSSKTKET